MKKLRNIFTLILVFLISLIPIFNIFAEVILADGYNQVINIGNTVDSDDPDDGVSVSKMITETKKDSTKNLENYFDITLTVKTKSQAKEQDLAIVVVMDISNTMIESSVEEGVSRYDAALAAGKKLIEDFATYSANVSENTKRKIGYVAFNSHANKIFDLTSCKGTNCNNLSTNKSLINTMEDAANSIITNTSDNKAYKDSYDRFTNIEGGLKMAYDMLYTGEGVNIQNKYIILLSDGFPTTYLDPNNANTTNDKYVGYNTYTAKATSSGNGQFYDHVRKKPCKYGTSYSDEAASRAQIIASTIKTAGTKIYTVGTGIDSNIKTISYYDEAKINADHSIIDRKTNNHIIGEDYLSFRRWLGGTGDTTNPGIGSGFDDGYYFNTTDSDSLSAAYQKIFDDITSASDASWVAEDPMNSEGSTKNIEFIGLYNDAETALYDNLENNLPQDDENNKISNTATFSNDKINWDLKKSAYTTESGEDGITYYYYQVKYRVRLKNESKETDTTEAFKELTEYQTNGTTTLTYIVSKTNQAPQTKTIDFPIPSVLGYLGELSFNKVSDFDGSFLSNATFELTHANDCPCKNERKHEKIIIDSVSKTSEPITGNVTFNNIPSGHKYTLRETSAPENYIGTPNIYNVIVSYGNTEVYLNDKLIENFNTVINEIEKGNLKISKTVKSDDTKGIFKFIIEIKNNDVGINKELKYKKNNSNELNNIVFKDGVAYINDLPYIELKHQESITIMGIPYKSTYKIEEINTEGYAVEHCVNSNTSCLESDNIQIGEIANGNIEIGDNNNVEFVNITGFILPATGSSGTLILLIIGSLLLIMPIIYIGYMFYKNEKEDKLTSNI